MASSIWLNLVTLLNKIKHLSRSIVGFGCIENGLKWRFDDLVKLRLLIEEQRLNSYLRAGSLDKILEIEVIWNCQLK